MNNKKQMSIRRALKNPRTRRRIGGTMETHPGEFADPGTARIEALRRIVRDHQYEKIDGQMVDGFTASAIVQLYDALNETNRAKYRAMTVPKMASVAWKFVKNPRGRRLYIEVMGRKVIFSPDAVHDFKSVFPASGLQDRAYWFEFDETGDLVDTDVPEQDDGPGASALADDAKAYLFEGDSQKWMRNPRRRERAIARAGVTDKKYLSRPSQLSRTTPSKRLRSRRSVNLSAGREGFFPNPGGVRIVHNKLLGGWFIVRGPHQTPLGGRFDSKAQAEAHLLAQKARRDMPRTPAGLDDEHALIAGDYGRTKRNPTRKSRSLILLTGQHSGKVYGFAEESDLRLDNTGTLRRAALALANKHHEPIRFERVSVTTLSPRMKENPAPRADRIAAASKRFTRFTGHRAANVRNLPFPENPGAALAVGPVLVLGYSATRDGKTENYLHKFTRYAAPLVAASHDGNSLYLLGGKYKFTERGIVDLKPR